MCIRDRIIPFTMGSVANNGGIALNKWDENRQANPWAVSYTHLAGLW